MLVEESSKAAQTWFGAKSGQRRFLRLASEVLLLVLLIFGVCSTAFLVSRNEESLSPVDLLIAQSELAKFGKLVWVSTAQLNGRLSVNQSSAQFEF